jgi:GrpB-like predicted nucleotidyltransferase (UPF0157 family)/ribosomal protein S18 acetylase RimI-like enzyme
VFVEPSEYGALEDVFLYKVIFLPDGVEPLPREVLSEPSIHNYIKGFGREGDVYFVCKDGGGIIGAAWSRVLDDPNCRRYGNIGGDIPELTISVLPEYRNKGIGTELIRRLHGTLGAAGDDRISLSVQRENPAARRYRHCGYPTVKEQDEDFIMVCRLDGQDVIAFGLKLAELWQLFPIQLAEHDPAWREWYDNEAADLNNLLGNAVERIDHIGSTAIVGLLAKPIVDILLQVSDDCDIDDLKDRLAAAAGWLLMAEQMEPHLQLDFNKGYTPDGFAERVYHLHIRRVGDWDELHFRDYIIAHPDAAAEYAALKRRLLANYEFDRDAYTEAKGGFIRGCTARARGGTT